MKQLGIDSTALGFKAGFTGNYIEDYLHQKILALSFISVPGMTRINVFTQELIKPMKNSNWLIRTSDSSGTNQKLF